MATAPRSQKTNWYGPNAIWSDWCLAWTAHIGPRHSGAQQGSACAGEETCIYRKAGNPWPSILGFKASPICRLSICRPSFHDALKETSLQTDSVGMKAEQFIQFANEFARTNAKTSSDEIHQAYQDNLDCLARPGDQVVVIRKPWPQGQWGKVISFQEFNPCYFRIELELQGKIIFVPASALARWVGAPDCEKAELQNIYLLMKINGLKLAH
jgi:hypothetical protein